MTTAGESGTEYTYDSLDRVASRNGADFSYAGLTPDPVKDNNSTYGRGASDEILSVLEGTGDAQLTVTDKHGDVVGDMSATDGTASALTASTVYDPFGETAGDTTGNAGYQGDWTDPDTDQVNMGARWYDPGTGAFDSRDSYTYASGSSILANRYTYGAGSPMDYSDPDGHWPSCGFCSKVIKKIKNNKYVKKAYKTAKRVKDAVVYAVRNPRAALSKALDFAGRAVNYLYRKSGLKTIVDYGKKIYRSAEKQTREWAREGRTGQTGVPRGESGGHQEGQTVRRPGGEAQSDTGHHRRDETADHDRRRDRHGRSQPSGDAGQRRGGRDPGRREGDRRAP